MRVWEIWFRLMVLTENPKGQVKEIENKKWL